LGPLDATPVPLHACGDCCDVLRLRVDLKELWKGAGTLSGEVRHLLFSSVT
jgi:hypothetical protein